MPKWILFIARAYAPLGARCRLLDATADTHLSLSGATRDRRVPTSPRLPTIVRVAGNASPHRIAA